MTPSRSEPSSPERARAPHPEARSPLESAQHQRLLAEYAEYARSGEFSDLESGEGLDDEGERWH